MTKSTKETSTDNVITIASLNLWRFNDWENRLPNIVKVLRELSPDIILLQEAQLNKRIDHRNQIEILNTELGYPFSTFQVAEIKTTRKGIPLGYSVDHGLGVLSRISFAPEVIKLTKADDGKEQRILLKCTFDANGTPYTITNLHFSNSDIGAENHFKETLDILNKGKIKSILVGDFNIFDMSKYRDLYGDKYQASSDLYEYVSYPEDNASLDYILLPHGYEFQDFFCLDVPISDHKMIVSKIKL